jgi:hypothetical protein
MLANPVEPMLEVASALEAIHAVGVLHRDLKPSNLILRPDGNLALIDFGLARTEGEDGLTATGVGGDRASPASDFYAWGVTLFVLLEGRPPIPNEKLADWAMHAKLDVSWEVTAPGSPARRVVQHCLTHDPARRPTSRAQLEAVLAGGNVDPEAPTLELAGSELTGSTIRTSPEPDPTRPPRVLPALAALALLAGVAAWPRGGPSPPPASPLPPPAPTLLPEAAALDRAAADLARLFAWPRPAPERDPSWIRDPTVRQSMEALADVRLPIKLRRTKEAAEDWLRALGPQGPHSVGDAQRFQEQVVGTLVYALGLYRGIQAVHGSDAANLLGAGNADGIRTSLALDHEELLALGKDTALGLVAASQGEARLVFEGFAVGLANQRCRPALVPELMAALEAEPPSRLRSALGMALDFANLHVDSRDEFPCPDRARAADFRARFYLQDRVHLSIRARWLRLMRALSLEVKLDRACQRTVTRPRVGEVEGYLDEVVRTGGEAKDLVALGLEETYDAATRIHLLFDDPSPWMAPLLERIARLRQRYPVRESERIPGS